VLIQWGSDAPVPAAEGRPIGGALEVTRPRRPSPTLQARLWQPIVYRNFAPLWGASQIPTCSTSGTRIITGRP